MPCETLSMHASFLRTLTKVSCCRLQLKAMDAMPQRSTDGAFCVNEEKYLKSVNVVKGDAKVIKREKGLETQYPLSCPLCDVMIAYR